MTRDVPDLGRQSTLRKYAEARAGRPLEMTRDRAVHYTCQDNENTEVATQEPEQKFSTFTSSNSTYCKTKNKPIKREMCECKLDTGNEWILMPIRMYK